MKLHLRRYVQDETGPHVEELPSETLGPGGELTLYFDPDHEERNLYVVDVINESKLNVYPHVFTLSSDYSISLLYPPEGVEEAVTPGNTYPIGLQAGTSQLSIWLPPGWDASRDCLKAIVTTQAADLRLLEQQALDVDADCVVLVRLEDHFADGAEVRRELGRQEQIELAHTERVRLPGVAEAHEVDVGESSDLQRAEAGRRRHVVQLRGGWLRRRL